MTGDFRLRMSAGVQSTFRAVPEKVVSLLNKVLFPNKKVVGSNFPLTQTTTGMSVLEIPESPRGDS
jgi:hypothetical protein